MKAAGLAYGILLLAHGGDPRWNAEVEKLRASADHKVPVELALGMADAGAIGAAVKRLETRGATKIVAVPLFVHSRSEVMDQTRYVLGLAVEPSEVMREAAERFKAMPPEAMPAGHAHHNLFSLEKAVPSVPTVIVPALDDSSLVSDILLERAQAISRWPRQETVVLVAHGPVDEKALPAWETDLAVHAKRLMEKGRFRAVVGATLRDDASPEVRSAAVKKLRAIVAEGGVAGRVLVLPVLLAKGGIEVKIAKELTGLHYAWSGEALLPHPGFDAWLLARGQQGAALADMRREKP